MATKKRITKHQLKEDQFVSGVFKFQEWAEDHLNTLFLVGAIVIIAAAGIWYFASQSSHGKQEAANLLGRADMQARNGQSQLAIIDYQKVLSDFSGSDAAKLAAIKLGNVYFNTNDYANASSSFKQYLDKFDGKDEAAFSAMRGLAMSDAAQGNFQTAATEYWQLAEQDTVSGFGSDYLLKTVNFAIKANDTTLAREAYSKLESAGGTSEESRMAKVLMIENGYLTYDEGEYE